MTFPQEIQDEINEKIANRTDKQKQAAKEHRAARVKRSGKPILTDKQIIAMRRKRFARKGAGIHIMEGIPVKQSGDFLTDNFAHFAWQTFGGLHRPIHFAQASYLTVGEMLAALKFWSQGRPTKQKVITNATTKTVKKDGKEITVDREGSELRDKVSALYTKLAKLAPEKDAAWSLAGEVKYNRYLGAGRQRKPVWGPITPDLLPPEMVDPILGPGMDGPDDTPITPADPHGPPRGHGGPPISVEEVERM